MGGSLWQSTTFMKIRCEGIPLCWSPLVKVPYAIKCYKRSVSKFNVRRIHPPSLNENNRGFKNHQTYQEIR